MGHRIPSCNLSGFADPSSKINKKRWIADVLIDYHAGNLHVKTTHSTSELSQFQTILATANLMAMIWLLLRFMTPFGWVFSIETFGGFVIVGLLLSTGAIGAFYFLVTPRPPTESHKDIIDADSWNEAERRIVSYLLLHSGECFQSDLLEKCMFSNSVKVTRTVAKLVERGALVKFRDGMGNRLVLHEDVSLSKSRRFHFGN
ncbi:MAG: helix-turn-helix transcriptional regulator [Candidatus Poseidoniaceae archaeon]